MSSQAATATGLARGAHVVDFYGDEQRLAASVGAYLADGRRDEEALVVIATERHRALIEGALAEQRVERPGGAVESARAEVWLDAADTLAWCASDGLVDRGGALALLGDVVRAVGAARTGTRVYGEIAALAWDAGHVQVALGLEEVWNELKAELPFTLYCSYAATSLASLGHAGARARMDALHTGALREPALRIGAGWEQAHVSGNFPPDPEAPRHARALVRTALAKWGVAEPRIGAADLVVSELATNAVLHVVSPFSVTARIAEWTLRLEVRDAGRASPASAQRLVAHPTHGLGIVDSICTRWGYDLAGAGKVVWAEIALSDGDRAEPD